MRSESILARAALSYANRLWRVIPLHTPTGDPRSPCSCGVPTCDKPGKHPRIKDWVNLASIEAEIISRWWRQWPEANIGIATGRGTGWDALDIDGAVGARTLQQLEKRAGHLPEGPFQITGGGGWHRLFEYRPGLKNAVEFAPGLDIRTDGGLIVVEPSLHVSGKEYLWEPSHHPDDIPLPRMPGWMAEMVSLAGKKRATAVEAAGGLIDEGHRNETLFKIGCAMRARGSGQGAILAALEVENTERCNPPLPSEAVETIAESASKYQPGSVYLNGHGAAKPIDELRDDTKLPKPAATNLTHELAIEILETDHFAQDGGSRLYVWKGGVYRPEGSRHLEKRVKELLLARNQGWTQHRAREVVEFIRVDAPTLWERPPRDTVNVKNGLLNVNTRATLPHSPDFLSPVQLPVDYDAQADCPAWENFVYTTFPEDAATLPWEIVAWMMTPDTSIQKAILLLGEGSNGKSTFLQGVLSFIGVSNVVTLSLQKLEKERFAAVRLLGKLANICPDLPSVHLTDTSLFKAITGGDSIAAEYKHRDGFDFTPFAHLIFSANHPPQSSDASPAFFRRWLVVPFNRIFEESEAIPRRVLDARLAQPAELSGVLNLALAALPALREKGFHESDSMKEAWRDLRSATDPLAVWLDRETVDMPTAVCVKKDLWRSYNISCADTGRPAMAENSFSRALRRLKPQLGDAQRTVAGKVQHVWLGLGVRSALLVDDGTGVRQGELF